MRAQIATTAPESHPGQVRRHSGSYIGVHGANYMYEVSQSDCGQQERSSRLSERLRGSARWVAAEGSWRVGRTVLTVLTILTAGRVLRLKIL